jgi:peroxiredoxin
MRVLPKRLSNLILPALALVWITGAYAGYRVGENATDFSLEPAVGGEAVSLSQFKGKPVLVVFWATWCPPCRREMPVLKKLHEKYAPAGLEIVSISIPYRQTRESVVNFQEKNDLPFTVLWDSENTAARSYQVSQVPTNFFVDPEGVVRLKGHNLTPELEDLIIEHTAPKGKM